MNAGEVISGRFELEAVAGAGGMGTVWRSTDRSSGERVAVKLLPPQPGWEGERLVREARVLAELHHPAIVRYVTHGTTDSGAPYLAMEWLDGENLADRLSRSSLSLEESLELAVRVADALAAAHALGVVHRDIKPSNLFLRSADVARVTVLDFGIARLAGATVAMTRTGMVLGTPMYMAPEQARGERDLDSRADVFSLGCVLFECLTGRPAFSGDHPMAIFARILIEDPPPASSLRPGIPREVDDLVSRMLDKDPDRRPSDGAAVVGEITRVSLAASLEAAFQTAPARTITAGEQRLLSVVVAAVETSERAVADDGTTMAEAPGDDTLAFARRSALAFGAHLEQLADGTLVATLAGGGAATDRAAQAARCALALRALLPDRAVALATGRGEIAAQVPVGEVIDRAVLLLEPSRVVAHRTVRIDGVTAGLLDPRFVVRPLGEDYELLAEEEPELSTRTLLGRPTPCVGRDRELATLEAIFAECVGDPAARVVVLTGPAGIGKSRLVSELVQRVERHPARTEVWIGRGDPIHANEAFGLVAPAVRRAAGLAQGMAVEEQQRRLLERVGASVPSEHRARVSAFLGEMVGVEFPESHTRQLSAARQNAMVMGDQIRRAFEDWVAAECRQGPLLLVLDGLQWGSLASVQLVDSALRNLRDLPFMVLAVARPEAHERFPRLFVERSREEIRLGGLARRAAAHLVREMLGSRADEGTTSRLVEQAAGSPFFLEELIRAVADGKQGDLPETVLAMLETRLEALPPEARRLLRAASVFGDRFPRRGVETLLGEMEAPEVGRWLEQLEERELLTRLRDDRLPDQDGWVFRHPLLRDAVYATLTRGDRELGHRLAGGFLASSGADEPRVLAEHFDRGGEPERALHWYLEAAGHALKGHDFAAALDIEGRSAELGAAGPELGRLRLIAAEARHWRGEAEAAERSASEALRLLPSGSREWFAAAALLAATAGRRAHHVALVELAETLTRSLPEPAPPAAAPAVAATAVALLHTGRFDLADRLIGLLGDPEEGRDDPYAQAWVERGHAIRAAYAGETCASLRFMEASASHFEKAGDLRTACQQQGNVGYLQRELGLYRESEATLRGVLDVAERLGLDHIVPTAKHNLGMAVALLGRLEEARTLEDEAVLAFARQGDRRFEGTSRVYLTRIHLAAGDLASAERQATVAIEVLEPVPQSRAVALAALAQVLLRQGRARAALARAEEASEALAAVGGTDEGESLIRLALAEARRANGDVEGARAALRVARDALQNRADRITDASWRASFLEQDPDNARILELARGWL